MEAKKADAPSKTTGDNKTETATAAKAAMANDGNKSKSINGACSEDFLIFGARPSHLFDDIAITIDSLLTEEVSTLPLLPRTLTEQQKQRHEKEGGKKPQTGEEKLIARLRKAYKKNIDLAEAYCTRNVFTVQSHSKTKRRKILESYLAQDDEGEKTNNDNNDELMKMPATTFSPPPGGELPTPDQLIGMDKEILVTRQRIQQAKQRRIHLKRQLERLNKASDTLKGVQEALNQGLEGKSNNGDGKSERSAMSMQQLKESVTNAMEGHEELEGWNTKAEEVIQLLDKIKAERDEQNDSNSTEKAGPTVSGREKDERERKRMLAQSGDGSDSQMDAGSISTLLKKIRGN